MEKILRLFTFSTNKIYIKLISKGYCILFIGVLLSTSNVANAQLPLFDDFETNFGNWNDGGGDCSRPNSTLLNGNRNILLRDNSGVASSMFTDPIDLTAYSSVTIEFLYQVQSFESGEDFFVEYNDGSGFVTIGNYVVDVDFTENITSTISITLNTPTYNLSNNARFRIRADASGNADSLYVDDVNIFGTLVPSPGNDECANAIALTPDTLCNPVIGTTLNATQSMTGCTGTADDDVWYSFVATGTEQTITVEADTIDDIVFEVFSGGCTGTSLVCEDSNSGSSTESATLTGLTIGDTYHIRIYSWSNNTSDQGTFSVCVIGPCIPSTANGTTTLGCPSVDAGGVGLSGADATINCSINSLDLEASYLELGETSSYTVESIPFNPPFQFGCLANPVSVNQDDVFSPTINLPFDFCYYGNTYNSCVIGSNGVISFDTSLSGADSGWRILQGLPTNNHAYSFGPFTSYNFGPSIHGVHHDVDPSVGGEIGYQLITLNTGCRAFVASWSDVPMYDDNSILYTGMIVFYEDTNVIEVYVKEKNIDGTWNDGNATIGLQGASGQATVAPSRNGLSTNWSAIDEAWRFTPSGASITDLKWYENSISPANEIIDPDDDGIITVSPFDTTTYFAEVTYNLCNGTTIIETDATTVTVTGTKTWNGSASTAWENPNNWTPVGIPLPADCIVIPVTGNDPIMASTSDGTGYNLSIEDGASLTQQSSSTLTIEDVIIIEPNGDLEVRDDASVIQITDVATNQNTGTARVQREVTGVDYFDYVYWSSPVDAFNVEDISPGTPSFAIYEWMPTVANGTAGEHGSWFNTSGNMTLGKGYIVRGLLGGSIANTAEFAGILNNGQISFPISRGTWTGADYAGIGNTATADDDNWNLLGNPYPSAISLTDFTAANPDIDGTLYFWRHLTPTSSAIANPFYEGYTYNYSASDYLSANSSGSTPPGFNGFIAAGQGFFALMLDSAPTSSTVTFSNTMRGVYDNSGFYRHSSFNDTSEKHRIWLDLVNESNNTANSILVGYIDGATNEVDRLFDGILLNQTDQQFYAIISDKAYVINGKGLPFDDTDSIQLGYRAGTAGSYSISINSLDGLFDSTGQDIYLEDTELNIIHDLRLSPYSFATEQGTFDNRFILRFNANSLGTNDQAVLSNLTIKTVNKTINASSPLSNIEIFELYDVTGRTIHSNLKVNSANYTYQTNNLSHGTYIVKVSLSNGATTSKKLILN